MILSITPIALADIEPYFLEMVAQGQKSNDDFRVLCGGEEVLNRLPLGDSTNYFSNSLICTLDSKDIKGIIFEKEINDNNYLDALSGVLNFYFTAPNDNVNLNLDCDLNIASDHENYGKFILCENKNNYEIYGRVYEGKLSFMILYNNKNTWNAILNFFQDLFSDDPTVEFSNLDFEKVYFSQKTDNDITATLFSYFYDSDKAIIEAKNFKQEIKNIGEYDIDSATSAQILKFKDLSSNNWLKLVNRLDIQVGTEEIINEDVGCGDGDLNYQEACDGNIFRDGNTCADYVVGGDETVVTCVAPGTLDDDGNDIGCSVDTSDCIVCEDHDEDNYYTLSGLKGDLKYLGNPTIGSLFITPNMEPIINDTCVSDCKIQKMSCELSADCSDFYDYYYEWLECRRNNDRILYDCGVDYDNCLLSCSVEDNSGVEGAYLGAQVVPLVYDVFEEFYNDIIEDYASTYVSSCDDLSCLAPVEDYSDIQKSIFEFSGLLTNSYLDMSFNEELNPCVWNQETLTCEVSSHTNLGYFSSLPTFFEVLDQNDVEPIFLLKINIQNLALENDFGTPNIKLAFICGGLAKAAQNTWKVTNSDEKIINNFILLSKNNDYYDNYYYEAYESCRAGIKAVSNADLYYDLPRTTLLDPVIELLGSIDDSTNIIDGLIFYNLITSTINFELPDGSSKNILDVKKELGAKLIIMPLDLFNENNLFEAASLNPNYLLLENSQGTDEYIAFVKSINEFLSGFLYLSNNNPNMIISETDDGYNILTKDETLCDSPTAFNNFYVCFVNNDYFDVVELDCPTATNTELDCDDNVATTYPGAEELFPGVDSDCDGVVYEPIAVPFEYNCNFDASCENEDDFCVDCTGTDSCTVDDDCAVGYKCTNGFCVYKTSTGGSSCFPPGSKVLTPDGLVNIELLKPGDSVIDGDEKINIIEKVFEHIKPEDKALRITFDNGKQLKVTVSHPIKTPINYVYAGDLNIGDQVVTTNGLTKIVQIEDLGLFEVDYSLHLKDEPHNHYVEGILVHNAESDGNKGEPGLLN